MNVVINESDENLQANILGYHDDKWRKMCTKIKSRIIMTKAAFNKTFHQKLDSYVRKKLVKFGT